MDTPDFRHLHDALLHYEGDAVFPDLLAPWIHANPSAHAWLASFRQREGTPVPHADVEELWDLYALSRICDQLLLRFQASGQDPSEWPGLPIAMNEFVLFVEALGLTVSRPGRFAAFYHEVTDVESCGVPRGDARILAWRWPCVMLGNMMFVRAGVAVSAGAGILAPGIADRSTLYWTYRRRARLCQDLSHGWGSNSQWRTAFRRDYIAGGSFLFNVDGKRDLATYEQRSDDIDDPAADLTLDERIELLTHRCFVTCTKSDEDLWPYDDSFTLA